jgi:saccharopine dehydrogenase (NAD+, L-lysine-forming)
VFNLRVLLLGAGGQGGPCASILAHDPDVEDILLGDINLETAERVQTKINSAKVSVARIDASVPERVAEAAHGKDVVIDLVTPLYYYRVLQGALEAGVHYVNTAFDRFMWDGKMELGKKPKLQDAFQAKGISALLGCGMSSGYTNVLARLYADRLDTVKSVKVRLAKKDTSLGKYGDAVTAWNPGWDPRQALLDFVLPATIFRDGKYEVKEKPFSEIEEWKFPEPIGRMPVSMHAHEEPYSIPLRFSDRGLTYCDFKYYVNMQIAPLISLGLASQEPIDVKGQQVKPLDMVLALTPKPSEGFLNENPADFDHQDETKLTYIMLEVAGKKDGAEKVYTIFIPTMNNPRRKMYALYGTALINVALPAVTGAKMLAKGGQPTGIIYPHDLDPEDFLKTMSNSGYEHKFVEV